MNTPLDLRLPLHASAYLKAASHYLSGWPQKWNAETLALALVNDEDPNQKKVHLWIPIENIAADLDSDPHLHADSLISDLAESFIEFLEENR